MQKAETQHQQTQRQPADRQGNKATAVESPQGEQIAQFETLAESGPQAREQTKLASMIEASPRMAAQRRMADMIHNSPRQAAQRKVAESIHNGPHLSTQRKTPKGELADEGSIENEAESLQSEVAQREEAPAKPNNTGLPDNLKSGIESLSGMSMDNVKVHYNSPQPARLNAHAYAQGTDIHVAPGQEQHLPHEAWHVVQQAQGLVQPTMQMKESIPVNDEKGLEHEADVMGDEVLRIAQRQKARPGPIALTANGSVTQLKRKYQNTDNDHLQKAWAAVQQFEKNEKIPNSKRLDHTEFVYGITGLTVSAMDYGSIDLDSPQQIGLLYYYIRKQAENLASMEGKDLRSNEALRDPARKEQIAKGHIDEQEKEAKLKNQQKEKEKEEYFKKSPDPKNTVELAILGAGAATAYYLTSMGSKINRNSTLVIGMEQPWAGLRGPGVINHPEHMITALRDEVGLKDEALMDRQAFSKSIETVISLRTSRRNRNRIKAVDKIQNKSTNFYEIKMDDDKTVYYAQRVIAGLGIGPHAERVNKKGVHEDKHKHILDMDSFQRKADTIPEGSTIFVAGGNAAIDVVTTCIAKKFVIIWYPGTRKPAFLQGTDNEIAEEEYQNFQKKHRSKIFYYKQERAGTPGDGVNKPLMVSGHEADYYVYGQGPDINKIKALFNKQNILDKLVDKTDTSHYFRGKDQGATLGLQMPVSSDDPTSLEIIGGSAFRMAKDSDKFQGVIDTLPNNVVGSDQLAPIRAQVEAGASFVPSYVEDNVNMAVDNITVIAMHIAIKYPNLSKEDANMWADRIIRWRRPSGKDIQEYSMLQGPIPNPHGKPRENARSFSAWFKKRLSEENAKAKQK